MKMNQGTYNLVAGIGTGLVTAIILNLFNITNAAWFSMDMLKVIVILTISIYAGQRAVNTLLNMNR